MSRVLSQIDLKKIDLNNLFKSFKDLDIRVGTIIHAELFKEAINPSYKLKIDFGELGILKSSAQITKNYSTEMLIGFQIIAIVNFPKKQIANYMSECLVLGAVEGESVILITPENKIANGLKIA